MDKRASNGFISLLCGRKGILITPEQVVAQRVGKMIGLCSLPLLLAS